MIFPASGSFAYIDNNEKPPIRAIMNLNTSKGPNLLFGAVSSKSLIVEIHQLSNDTIEKIPKKDRTKRRMSIILALP